MENATSYMEILPKLKHHEIRVRRIISTQQQPFPRRGLMISVVDLSAPQGNCFNPEISRPLLKLVPQAYSSTAVVGMAMVALSTSTQGCSQEGVREQGHRALKTMFVVHRRHYWTMQHDARRLVCVCETDVGQIKSLFRMNYVAWSSPLS